MWKEAGASSRKPPWLLQRGRQGQSGQEKERKQRWDIKCPQRCPECLGTKSGGSGLKIQGEQGTEVGGLYIQCSEIGFSPLKPSILSQPSRLFFYPSVLCINFHLSLRSGHSTLVGKTLHCTPDHSALSPPGEHRVVLFNQHYFLRTQDINVSFQGKPGVSGKLHSSGLYNERWFGMRACEWGQEGEEGSLP